MFLKVFTAEMDYLLKQDLKVNFVMINCGLSFALPTELLNSRASALKGRSAVRIFGDKYAFKCSNLVAKVSLRTVRVCLCD